MSAKRAYSGDRQAEAQGEPPRERHDFLTQGIVAAAIVLFVGIGGSVVPELVKAWRGMQPGPEILLANALILNVALILLGWSRYKALSRELEQRRQSEEEARRLALTDPLTGCLNRRGFTPEVTALITAATVDGKHVAVAMIDLDNFKNINDFHGHQLGDAVLLQTARRFADILPVGALLARLGGDEFAFALAYSTADHAEVETLVERIVAIAAEPVISGEVSVEISASVGIATTQDSGTPTSSGPDCGEQLMNHADIAMYQAKKMGRNRLEWFEPAMEYEQRFRGELEAGIRRGLTRGDFVPFYEQQIDLDDGKLTGFEMLARWESPELGLVSPDIFIPIIEDMGLIDEMSRQLLIQAFADARDWHPSLTLAVNVSPLQLRDPWFSQKMVKLLLANNFPASRLEVEITETAMHENIGMVRSTLTSLRNQGVKVALDDFGTGYSSLSQLRTLPFDRIKIDRSFIRDLKGPDAGKLLGAIISMGEGLDLPMVAEGVEDEQILAMLRSMGQLKGQGYHYGRPEPARKVIARLADLDLLAPDADIDSLPEVGAKTIDAERQKAG
ncbi:putative bifunctional diguanylate cyclase/phosphodiesterase [Qipengyuania sp.]|uniref:putative bifunctional diguanylate cyclase/phosphodiesterase n=1 Tax=Qipengyuania sp. TaxID=2004515 RepID=UPI0035C87E4A